MSALDNASALLAAYAFYPDNFMNGTKPDPSELAVMTGLLHYLGSILERDPYIYDPAKHPKSLDDLKRMYRISYGMSRSRFMRALSTFVQVVDRAETFLLKRQQLMDDRLEWELEKTRAHNLLDWD